MYKRNQTVILETAYWPPVQYFSKLLAYARVRIEQHDHYVKQSYRNRCHILGPNGVQPLSVQVKKTHHKMKIKDLRIDFSKNWPQQHWRALVAAYKASPYFELLAPDLQNMYKSPPNFLLDWNTQQLDWLANLLEIELNISFTDDYKEMYPENTVDLRGGIHPKPQFAKPDKHFSASPYLQVFSDKFDFQPNMSILDLLFNCGQQTVSVLNKSFTGNTLC